MAKKTTIYLSDETEKALAAYGEENSLSGSIATIIARYQAITAEATPELSEPEWSAIVDALNGCGAWLSAGGVDPAGMVWAELYDSEPDGIGEKWGVEVRELAERLRALPFAGRCAVWDVAARFWASPRLNEIDTLALLIESGAKIKG